MTLVKKGHWKAWGYLMVTGLLASPLLAGAQDFVERQPGEALTDPASFYGLLSDIFVFVYSIFFAVAAFFILWAAFTYLVAGGNEEKVEEAKNRLIYAIIGIVVALLALSIDNLVANLIGVA